MAAPEYRPRPAWGKDEGARYRPHCPTGSDPSDGLVLVEDDLLLSELFVLFAVAVVEVVSVHVASFGLHCLLFSSALAARATLPLQDMMATMAVESFMVFCQLKVGVGETSAISGVCLLGQARLMNGQQVFFVRVLEGEFGKEEKESHLVT